MTDEVTKHLLHCGFCNAPQEEAKLIAGPSDFICHGCIEKFSTTTPVSPLDTVRCNFCGNSPTDTAKFYGGPSVYICDGCVQIAKDIVDNADADKVWVDEMVKLSEARKSVPIDPDLKRKFEAGAKALGFAMKQ